MKEVERVGDEEDDPLARLDDVKEDAVQNSGADLVALKGKFGE